MRTKHTPHTSMKHTHTLQSPLHMCTYIESHLYVIAVFSMYAWFGECIPWHALHCQPSRVLRLASMSLTRPRTATQILTTAMSSFCALQPQGSQSCRISTAGAIAGYVRIFCRSQPSHGGNTASRAGHTCASGSASGHSKNCLTSRARSCWHGCGCSCGRTGVCLDRRWSR